jgi:transcriptional regulator GlxA family with amidase domain
MGERTPKRLGFVGHRANDRTLSFPGHDNRLAPQLRVVPLLDRAVERLHFDRQLLFRRGFQRVLDEARHQMARYYLSNSVLELNEAAYLLGFEDPNSFGRAFRTWEGVPPSDWRETHRSSAPN